MSFALFVAGPGSKPGPYMVPGSCQSQERALRMGGCGPKPSPLKKKKQNLENQNRSLLDPQQISVQGKSGPK